MPVRLTALDAMRGIAALAVVLFHEGNLTAPVAAPMAYLAVDFFFVLSGFVLEMVYGKRLADGLAGWTFLRARYLRFLPMAATGALLGAIGFVLLERTGKGVLSLDDVLRALPNLMLLPAPAESLYPLDGPLWSLFFELLVNALFAMFYRYLKTPVLIGVVVVSAAALVSWALSVGTIDAGPAWTQFPGGLARVTFSFSTGVLLYRWRPRVSLPSVVGPGCIVVLATALCLPEGVKAAVELPAVLVVFPFVVWVGAATDWDPAGISQWLGRLSFPIYAVHLPVFTILAATWGRLIGHSANWAPLSGFVILGACIVVAAVLEKYVDRPARQLVSGRAAEISRQVTGVGSAE